jgi:ribose transport system ATP-binding protein
MDGMILALRGIHKYFGAVKALRGVDLSVKAGEVHALIGENGAGKSTLMKVLSGVYKPESGQMTIQGNPYQPQNPAAGRLAGITMIYQELTLARHLTIEENIMLGIEQSKAGFVVPQKALVQALLNELGKGHLKPSDLVGALSIGEQQMVEIARALVTRSKIVIMDEPTSSLTATDKAALFEVIGKLKEQGIAVIYISHFLEEIEEICDRYTVLRDGESVATGMVKGTTHAEIIRHMVGRSVDDLYPHVPHEAGEILLEVENLSADVGPKSVSFQLRRGEILGLAGLVGAGRSETVRGIFGLQVLKEGKVTLKGNHQLAVKYLSPATGLRHGLNLLSENRKEEGLALTMSIGHNMTFSALGKYRKRGLLNLKAETRDARHWINKLQIKCAGPQQLAGNLSGGNQQKICLARLLHHNSDILFLDEPTRGIDVGSKAEIYRLIHELAAEGKAIVMISSYLPELLGVCDRVGVMYRGQLSPIRHTAAWSEDTIMQFATTGQLAEE